jgi:hypothetical protein
VIARLRRNNPVAVLLWVRDGQVSACPPTFFGNAGLIHVVVRWRAFDVEIESLTIGALTIECQEFQSSITRSSIGQSPAERARFNRIRKIDKPIHAFTCRVHSRR